MRTRSGSRAPLVALAALAALALGGCGTLPPGAAAVVDGTTIKHSDVTELAEAQCAGIEQAAQDRSVAGAGDASQAAGPAGAEPADGRRAEPEVRRVASTSAPGPGRSPRRTPRSTRCIESLPEKYRDYTSEVFRDWAEARDVLTQIGVRATGQPDTTDQLPDPDQRRLRATRALAEDGRDPHRPPLRARRRSAVPVGPTRRSPRPCRTTPRTPTRTSPARPS